jgi:hypothetical protein
MFWTKTELSEARTAAVELLGLITAEEARQERIDAAAATVRASFAALQGAVNTLRNAK